MGGVHRQARVDFEVGAAWQWLFLDKQERRVTVTDLRRSDAVRQPAVGVEEQISQKERRVDLCLSSIIYSRRNR